MEGLKRDRNASSDTTVYKVRDRIIALSIAYDSEYMKNFI